MRINRYIQNSLKLDNDKEMRDYLHIKVEDKK